MKHRCNRNSKLNRPKSLSFKDSWKKIRKSDLLQNHKINFYEKSLPFEEMLQFQDSLTDNKNIFRDNIDFSNFTQVSSDLLNSKNIYDCFHGILNFTYYYSGNKFNIKELEFHYSGSTSCNYLSLKKKQAVDQNDIMNIFDYSNITSQIKISRVENAFFGVTFKRIKVNPIAYSIRSDLFSNLTTHLISFTFEAFDENENKWYVLDERQNINDLIASGGFNMFFVRRTDKYFSSFRIKQTSPGSNEFWGFSISAFEIHGVIAYRDDLIKEIDSFVPLVNMNEDVFPYEYDPFLDMTEFI